MSEGSQSLREDLAWRYRRIVLGLAAAGLTVCLSQPALGQAEWSDTTLANSLASELAKAGVDLDVGDLSEMVRGIANGGQAGQALAEYISRALAQATNDLEAVAAGQDPGPALDQGEIDELLKNLPSSGDSAGELSRFLKEKLQELEKPQR